MWLEFVLGNMFESYCSLKFVMKLLMTAFEKSKRRPRNNKWNSSVRNHRLQFLSTIHHQ